MVPVQIARLKWQEICTDIASELVWEYSHKQSNIYQIYHHQAFHIGRDDFLVGVRKVLDLLEIGDLVSIVQAAEIASDLEEAILLDHRQVLGHISALQTDYQITSEHLQRLHFLNDNFLLYNCMLKWLWQLQDCLAKHRNSLKLS